MVRLRDIPPDVLHEIRKFAIQNKGKIPVTGGGKTPDGRYVKNMVELIREKWGVELSPGQIFALQRPKPKKVTLPGDVAGWLEEEFGTVGAGVKQVAELAKQMKGKPPVNLRMAVSRLGGQLLDYEEAVRLLKEMGYEKPDETIRELARLGFLSNEKGMLRFHRYKRPSELSLIRFLTG
jgi:hypothetical protein